MSEERIAKLKREIITLKRLISELDVNIARYSRQVVSYSAEIGTESSRKGGYVTHYRYLLREGREEEAYKYTEEVLLPQEKKLDELRKIREEVRRRLNDSEIERIKLEVDLEIAEEELAKLIKLVEFIDIDEETGYMIYYDKTEKKYFLVHPDDFKEGKIEAERYFETIEIIVNFTFDTLRPPKYPGQDEDSLRLEAEIRIIVRVREAGKALVDAVTYKMKLAFEHYVTETFEWNWEAQKHIIADGVVIDRKAVEFEAKSEMIDILKDIIPYIVKVGAYYRINDEPENMNIDDETADPEIYGEWSRAKGTEYEHSELFDFVLAEELDRSLRWSLVRKSFVGETGWEQLHRIKEEEGE